MEEKDRRALLFYKDYLHGILNFAKLKIPLQNNNIFSNLMIKDLYENDISDFFPLLCSRGPKAFEKFINILITNGYEKQAKLLLFGYQDIYTVD